MFAACNPSKHLKDGEYLLTKNTVKVEDKKGIEFDNLIYTVRPITNKKFVDVFPIKASLYVNNLPKTDSLGNIIKDTKWMKKMRAAGEEPVLLDTTLISYSLDQLRIAMKNRGYFNAESYATIKYKNPNKLHPKRHKAEVTYHVTANEAFYIRDVRYSIDIFEYKRIILKDTMNRLFKVGDRYDADNLIAEQSRIVDHIRDNGYYYVSNDIVSFEIDTLDAENHLDAKGNKTLSVRILVNFSKIKDKDIRERHAYKFYFNNVYIYPNYDITHNYNQSATRITYRKRKDDTRYYIITTPPDSNATRKNKPIADIRPRILTDNILSKSGLPYSQSLISRSRSKLNGLKNFNYIDIDVVESVSGRDTVNKTGTLNTIYRLSRNKLHSLAVQLEARSDKASLSLTYSNKNLFRSAEYFNINVYGSLGFYIKSKTAEEKARFILESEEVGGEISMDFRRLLFFRKTQKIEASNYGTLAKIGVHFQNNSLYQRGLYNGALVYTLAYTSNLTHLISPIDLSVINITPKGDEFYQVLSLYSKDFRQKYQDNFLLSFKYGLTYIQPVKDPRNSFVIRLRAESSGMFLSAICALAKAPKNEQGQYTIGGINYGNFERAELDLRYYYTINKNNSIATRFDLGVGIPLWNATTLPFEKSFYVGGSNSMRAWNYRSLGPGSYYTEEVVENDIRTGDIKLEMNLEYRGTIYKFIKYGIFVDAGNIWLSHDDADMPNAEFKFNRFYKEIGFGTGVGLRLDFGFFIIRLDAALPIYDPSQPPARRWIGIETVDGKKGLNKSVNFTFGIGHAF
ncbi:MAG: BamA/TamA family outer membrane protein [Bacteroidales bacterium]|nr:BamA/TamA family outer membrane protein [Bacteroidales bacterium]